MPHLELLHDHHLLVAGFVGFLTVGLAAALLFAVNYWRHPAGGAVLLRAGIGKRWFQPEPGGTKSRFGFGDLFRAGIKDRESEMIIVIPDIRGYTNFISFSGQSLGHAQHIVSELLTAVVASAADVLQVSQPEGDSVLLYSATHRRRRDRRKIAISIMKILAAFYRRKQELIGQTECSCNACKGLPDLEIKVVVHKGTVYQSQTVGFPQLVGLPVIVAHRLLKNSVSSRRYVLLTRDVADILELPFAAGARQDVETYEDLGRIETCVYEFDLEDLAGAKAGGSGLPEDHKINPSGRKWAADQRVEPAIYDGAHP